MRLAAAMKKAKYIPLRYVFEYRHGIFSSNQLVYKFN